MNLRQTGESRAGPVAYIELTPLLAREMPSALPDLHRLWLRGGFPPSSLATDDAAAFEWRQDFIQTFLQRDLSGMGVRVPAETLRRFWTMMAHLQGHTFNASALGQALSGASHSTAARYLDTLMDTLMVRRLLPLQADMGKLVGKRLVKSPKVYVRDSSVLHALLGLASVRDLQGRPLAGASWEGLIVEQVAAALPAGAQLSFYRTALGAELDLVVELGTRRFGIEIKFSSAPKPARGFWQSLKDLEIDRAWVIAPVASSYPLAPGVDVLPVHEITRAIEDMVSC